MFVVIPSIRTINTEYLKPILNTDIKIVVVDDSDEERIEAVSDNMIILHYSDRIRLMGEFETCIPRKNGASRDLGLWYAYVYGEKDEVVICLDDDCQIAEDYIDVAVASLGQKTLPLAKTNHRFYNLLDIYNLHDGLYPRGFPYEERFRKKDYDYSSDITGNVVFNLGLWDGVFDVNAIDKLYLPQYSFLNNKLEPSQVAIQKGSIASLCSMNMILKREVIPALYQLPMNERAIDNWQIDRYGDIWGGYITCKLIHIMGDLVTAGDPMIMHWKEDNDKGIARNMQQEHFAHHVNIEFCDLLDEACENIKPSDYLTMFTEYANNMEALQPKYSEQIEQYLIPTVKKMKLWAEALTMKPE